MLQDIELEDISTDEECFKKATAIKGFVDLTRDPESMDSLENTSIQEIHFNFQNSIQQIPVVISQRNDDVFGVFHENVANDSSDDNSSGGETDFEDNAPASSRCMAINFDYMDAQEDTRFWSSGDQDSPKSPEIRSAKCPICSKTYPSEISLIIHLKDEGCKCFENVKGLFDEKTNQCLKCGKDDFQSHSNCTKLYDLVDHVNSCPGTLHQSLQSQSNLSDPNLNEISTILFDNSAPQVNHSRNQNLVSEDTTEITQNFQENSEIQKRIQKPLEAHPPKFSGFSFSRRESNENSLPLSEETVPFPPTSPEVPEVTCQTTSNNYSEAEENISQVEVYQPSEMMFRQKIFQEEKVPSEFELAYRCKRCNECGDHLVFSTVKESLRHLIESHKTTRCPRCFKRVSILNAEFENHIKTHFVQNLPGPVVDCVYCNKKFRHETLWDHLDEKHLRTAIPNESNTSKQFASRESMDYQTQMVENNHASSPITNTTSVTLTSPENNENANKSCCVEGTEIPSGCCKPKELSSLGEVPIGSIILHLDQEQTEILAKAFLENPNPPWGDVQPLAKILGCTAKKIKKWLTSTRAKFKKNAFPMWAKDHNKIPLYKSTIDEKDILSVTRIPESERNGLLKNKGKCTSNTKGHCNIGKTKEGHKPTPVSNEVILQAVAKLSSPKSKDPRYQNCLNDPNNQKHSRDAQQKTLEGKVQVSIIDNGKDVFKRVDKITLTISLNDDPKTSDRDSTPGENNSYTSSLLQSKKIGENRKRKSKDTLDRDKYIKTFKSDENTSESDTKSKSRDSDTKSHSRDSDTKSHSRDSDTKSHSRDSDTKSHSRDSDTKSHSRDSDTKSHSRDSDTKSHSRDSDTKSHSRDSDTKSHSRDSDTKSHSRDSDTKSHSRDSDTKTHSWDSDTKSHSRDSDTKSHSRDSDTKSHSWDSDTKTHSRDSDTKSHSRDSDTKSHSRDSDTKSHSRDSDTKSHSRDSDTKSHSRDSDTKSHSRDSDTKSHSRDSDTKSHSRDSDTKSHSRDSDTKSHSRDSDTKTHSWDSDTKTHSWDSDTKSHSRVSYTKSHSRDSDTKSHSRVSDTKSHSRDSDTKSHSRDSDTKSHSRDSDTKSHSRDSDTKSHSRDSDTKSHSRDSDTKSHSRDSDTKSHSRDSDTKSHSRDSDTTYKSHSRDSDTTYKSHSRDSDTTYKSHSRDSDTKSNSRDSDTKSYSRDSDTKSNSRDSDTKSNSRDSDTKSHSRDSDTKSHSRDSDTKSHSRDSDTTYKSHSRDSDTTYKSHSRDSDTKSHSRDSDTKSHSRDSDTKSHSRDSDTKSKSRDSDTKSKSRDSNTITKSPDFEAKSNSGYSENKAEFRYSESMKDVMKGSRNELTFGESGGKVEKEKNKPENTKRHTDNKNIKTSKEFQVPSLQKSDMLKDHNENGKIEANICTPKAQGSAGAEIAKEGSRSNVKEILRSRSFDGFSNGTTIPEKSNEKDNSTLLRNITIKNSASGSTSVNEGVHKDLVNVDTGKLPSNTVASKPPFTEARNAANKRGSNDVKISENPEKIRKISEESPEKIIYNRGLINNSGDNDQKQNTTEGGTKKDNWLSNYKIPKIGNSSGKMHTVAPNDNLPLPATNPAPTQKITIIDKEPSKSFGQSKIPRRTAKYTDPQPLKSRRRPKGAAKDLKQQFPEARNELRELKEGFLKQMPSRSFGAQNTSFKIRNIRKD